MTKIKWFTLKNEVFTIKDSDNKETKFKGSMKIIPKQNEIHIFNKLGKRIGVFEK